MMSDRINTAYRVYHVLQEAVSQHTNQATAKVWAHVFGIDEPDETRRNFEISRCLNQLYGEIDVLERLMNETEFTQPLYLPYLNKARSAIVPHGITAAWNSYNTHLSPDTILSLRFCIEILPEEELAIDQNEISEIQELTITLEKLLEESKLPAPLKRIIENHIIKIREALYSYRIIGSKAMSEVVKSAYGEVIENQEVFATAKNSEPVKVLSKVWQKVKDVADSAKTANEGVAAGIDLVDKGVKLIGFVERILSST
jgi:hypothetical protein